LHVGRELVPRGDAASRARMHHADLESVAVETEVAIDPAQEPLDGRVGPDGPAAAPGAVRFDDTRLESGLVGPPEQPLEAPPVGPLELLQCLSLRHCEFLQRVRCAAPPCDPARSSRLLQLYHSDTPP